MSNLTNQDTSDARFQYLTSEENRREEIQKKRAEWLAALDSKNKKAVLFELEMLLAGIERFFHEAKRGNPGDDHLHLMTKDFAKELSILYDSVGKVVHLTTHLLNQADATFSFRQYIGLRLDDKQWLQDLKRGIEQNTPTDSLYLLCSSFKTFTVLLEGLLQAPMVPYHVFEHLGFLISREMHQNVHFSPRQFVQFSPLYDRIHAEVVQNFIRSIGNETLRRMVSVVLLVLFRILNYLKFVPFPCVDPAAMKKTLVIYSLISSEMRNLTRYLDNDVPQTFRDLAQQRPLSELETNLSYAMQLMSRRLKNDHEIVFHKELPSLALPVDQTTNRNTAVETAYGILVNACHHSVVRCVQVFDPKIDGKGIFIDFQSPLEQALQLRNDLMLFERILDAFEQALTSSGAQSVAPSFRSILEFADYFESTDLKAIRIVEYEKFRTFFARTRILAEKMKQRAVTPEDAESFKRDALVFREWVQLTLQEVSKREVLRDQKINEQSINDILLQYMQRFQRESPVAAA